MNDQVTKQRVQLYCLGALRSEDQRRVEDAFDTDPQVQAWFLELGELPEHVRAEDDELLTDMILEDFAQYRGALANEHDRALFAEADREAMSHHAASAREVATHDRADSVVTTPSAGRAEDPESESTAKLFSRLAELVSLDRFREGRSRELAEVYHALAERTPIITQYKMDFREVLLAAPQQAQTFPTGSSSSKYCEQSGEFINIRIPTSQSNGLVRLSCQEADEQKTITTYLPSLNRFGDYWMGKVRITDIYRSRQPVGPLVVWLERATPETRAGFLGEGVREFVLNELAPDSLQRMSALQFLGITDSSHEQE